MILLPWADFAISPDEILHARRIEKAILITLKTGSVIRHDFETVAIAADFWKKLTRLL